MNSSARKLIFLAFAFVGTSQLAYAQDTPADNSASAEDIAKLNDIFGSSSTSDPSDSSGTFNVQTVLNNAGQNEAPSETSDTQTAQNPPEQTGNASDSFDVQSVLNNAGQNENSAAPSDSQTAQTTPSQNDVPGDLFKAANVLDNLEKAVDEGTLGQNLPKKTEETSAQATDTTSNTDTTGASSDTTASATADASGSDQPTTLDNSSFATDSGNNAGTDTFATGSNTQSETYANDNLGGSDNNTFNTADLDTSNSQIASTATSANTTTAPTVTVEEPTIMTDALLDKMLREVSTSVDTLKEDTFTTKSRLLLLREEVLQRSVGGARLQLKHKYDMGGQYELVQVYYAIDQETVFSKQDSSGKLSDIDDQIIYDKMLAPGPHQLTVMYVYRGRPWGVFRYMKGYTFRVESGYDFIVDEGKAAELVVTAAENGNFFTAYEKRPGVKFDYQQYELSPQSAITDASDEASASSSEQ